MREPKPRSSSAEAPLTFALKRLARRSHSEGELSKKMARAGDCPQEIEATLSFLAERGYLNDAAFALEVARASAERKHWGPARIHQKLRSLDLSESDIEGALVESFPEGEEEAAAGRALERFSKRGGPGGERGRARAYRHLLGRGFSPEVAHRLVSTSDFGDTER
ncbi:MAG: regulatory protein RecX [Vicinamibacteria bacterium]